ncbi:MAG: CHAT domain-containing protein [Acidobacteriia bacterium]|nr:CHAT domain-containing protein [Terriglobia bacterium]
MDRSAPSKYTRLRPKRFRAARRLFCFVLFLVALAAGEDTRKPRYIPPELKASDPEVRRLLEQAQVDANKGDFQQAILAVEEATRVASAKKLVADMAIAEEAMVSTSLVAGDLEKARAVAQKALEDARSSNNLVVEASVLDSLAQQSNMQGRLAEAIQLEQQALDTAVRSKNLYMKARILGALASLQVNTGKLAEAQSAIDEAVSIDRQSDFDFLPLHLVYAAQIHAGKSTNAEVIAELEFARDEAIRRENYMVLVVAVYGLGNAYTADKHLDKATELLQRTMSGDVERNGTVVNLPVLKKFAELPLCRSLLLAGLGEAYKAAGQNQQALTTFSTLLSFARNLHMDAVAAAAAEEVARADQVLNREDEAIRYFQDAAELWSKLHYGQRLNTVLLPLGVLLNKNARHEEALAAWRQLEASSEKEKSAVFLFTAHGGAGRSLFQLHRYKDAERAFVGAESLVSLLYADKTINANALQKDLVSLYFAEALLYQELKQPVNELLVIEKAMLQVDPADDKSRDVLYSRAKLIIDVMQIRGEAERLLKDNKLASALLLCELINTFDNLERAWGKSTDKSVGSSLALQRLGEIPFKLIADQTGADALEASLNDTGPAAGIALRIGFDALMRYYLQRKNINRALAFGQGMAGLISFTPDRAPFVADVLAVCTYASVAAMANKPDLASAKARDCLAQAKRVKDEQSGVLKYAEQMTATILASESPGEAQESAQKLIELEPDVALHRILLATIYVNEGEIGKAIEQWDNALALLQKAHENASAAELHYNIGRQLLAKSFQQHSDLALSHLQQCRALYNSLSDTSHEIECDLAQADFCVRKRDQKEAYDSIERAAKLAKQLRNDQITATVLSKRGEIETAFDQLDNALVAHKQALEIYKHLVNKAGEANEQRQIGMVLQRKGDLEGAISSYVHAKQIADELPDVWQRAWSRTVLAWAYNERGDYESGIKLLKQARKLYSDSNANPVSLAWASYNLVAPLSVVGEWEEALGQAQEALREAQTSKDTALQFQVLSTLMSVYGERNSAVKNLNKAMEVYTQASALAKSNPAVDISSLADSVVEVLVQLRKYDEALARAQEALVYYRKSKNEVSEAHGLMSLAEVYRREHDYASAARALSEADPLVRGSHDLYTTGRYWYGQAGLARDTGDFTRAVELYKRVIDRIDLMKAAGDKERQTRLAESYGFIYDELIDCLFSLYSTAAPADRNRLAAEALEYSEANKAREFLASYGATFLRELRSRMPADVQERERAILAKRTQTTASFDKDFSPSDPEQQLFVDELRKEYPAYASVRYPRALELSKVPLHSGETLVEFRLSDSAAFVWTATAAKGAVSLVDFYKVPEPRSWFEQRVAKVRDDLNNGRLDETDTAALEDLYVALFPKPVLLDTKSLVIVPDGVLFLLPIELLSPRASSSAYPLASIPTRYYPSLSSLVLARSASSHQHQWSRMLFAIGDPVTSLDDLNSSSSENARGTSPMSDNKPWTAYLTRGFVLPRLPATATEVKNIAALFPNTSTEVRLGTVATKHSFLQTDVSTTRFLHFATHGIAPSFSSALEPALVFSFDKQHPDDLLLKTSEILRLNLNAEMVVLSACNTGSGRVTRVEGVSNLGRAFLMAGASSTTVSLWQVDDKSTALLMDHFYRHILEGKDKSEALALAKSELRASGYDNPFFWAPFIVMGE